jgi:F-type H+-transporting ATPase subunit b
MFLDETAWVAIAFVLFIGLVWKKASKAILTILDNRSNLIQDELNEARALKEEAMEKLRQASQIQQNSTEEFEQIIKDAALTAKNIKKEAEIKSLEMVKRREEQAIQKIEALEDDAIKDIKKISATIAVKSAESYIKTNLNKEDNNSLISLASKEFKSRFVN